MGTTKPSAQAAARGFAWGITTKETAWSSDRFRINILVITTLIFESLGDYCMTDTVLMMANGWRMIITANAESSEVRFMVGHPDLENHSVVSYPLKDLSRGIVLDLNTLMNTALGIPDKSTKHGG